MKFLITICIIAVISCRGVTAQNEDTNVLFASFVNSTLSGLKPWLQQNGLVPAPCAMDKGGSFKFDGRTPHNSPYHQMEGWIGEERWYYGHENNHRALSISSNLSTLSFDIDLGYGGPEDFVTGTYSVNGSHLGTRPIRGNGTFRRNIQIQDPLHFPLTCYLDVSDGFFDLVFCAVAGGDGPDFANMTLDGLESSPGNEWAINSFFNVWYSMQVTDLPQLSNYWRMYMMEVFAATPIVDIIGEELPPTTSKLNADKLKKRKLDRTWKGFTTKKSGALFKKYLLAFN